MIEDLYIVGDLSRLVVKNIVNQFQETGCNIKVFAPTDDDINNLPNFSVHLLILLSDNIDFNIIRQIVIYQRKYEYQLCFIGVMTKLSLEDDKGFSFKTKFDVLK